MNLAYGLGVPESFTETFAAGLASYGDEPCIEFEGRWYSGDEITGYADAIASVLRDAGVADDAPVGLVVRNRLPHAAAIIGFLAAGRPVSMIYSFQSPESIGRDIETAGPVGDRRRPRGLDRRGRHGREARRQCRRRNLVDRRRPSPLSQGSNIATTAASHAEAEPGVALQILTSGTTGPAETADDQDGGAGAHRVQRDQRRESPAGRPAGVRLLAVRRHRGMPAGRRRATTAGGS